MTKPLDPEPCMICGTEDGVRDVSYSRYTDNPSHASFPACYDCEPE